MENRFSAARRRYLREHMDGIYTGMLLTGILEGHLTEIGELAQAMFDQLMEQMKKAEVSLSNSRPPIKWNGTDGWTPSAAAWERDLLHFCRWQKCKVAPSGTPAPDSSPDCRN